MLSMCVPASPLNCLDAGGGCCEQEEAEDVDIGMPAPWQQDAAAQLGLSPDRLPLMHLPLVLNMPASGRRASDAAAAAPSPAAERGVPAAAVLRALKQ